MKEYIEAKYSGIICDHCGLKLPEVQFEEYIDYVNKECPDCGHNLLTKEDYLGCLKILKYVNVINHMLWYTRWLNPFFYYNLLKCNRNSKSNDYVTITKDFDNGKILHKK